MLERKEEKKILEISDSMIEAIAEFNSKNNDTFTFEYLFLFLEGNKLPRPFDTFSYTPKQREALKNKYHEEYGKEPDAKKLTEMNEEQRNEYLNEYKKS